MNGTELIINVDNSIYHLRLKPGDFSDLIITVGDPDRVEKVSQYFDRIDFRVSSREFRTHTGWIGKRRLTAISTGIGTDNIDVAINELHALHQMSEGKYYEAPKLTFIRLGTSGAIRSDIELDSVVLSERALGLDNLMFFYRWEHLPREVAQLLHSDERWCQLPRPYAATADPQLVKAFSAMATRLGVTVTAPGFYAPQGRTVNLVPRLRDLIDLLGSASFCGMDLTNIEMETAGIYGLADLLGHRAVSLSAILANRISGEFSAQADNTVDEMIRKALAIAVEL